MSEHELHNQMRTYLNFPKKLYMRTSVGKRDNGTLWARLSIDYAQHDLDRVPEIQLKNLLRNRGALVNWFRDNLIEMNKKTLPLFSSAQKQPPTFGCGYDRPIGQLHNFRIKEFKYQSELHCDIHPYSPQLCDAYVGATVCAALQHKSKVPGIREKKDIVVVDNFFITQPLDLDELIHSNFSAIIDGMRKRQEARWDAQERHRANNQPKKQVA